MRFAGDWPARKKADDPVRQIDSLRLKVREDELRPIGIPGLLFVPVKILMRSFLFYGFVKSSRCEAHLRVRRNDEVEAQRRRWTFYETILF